MFGRLLDPAGHWSIRPVAEFDVRRRYLPGSLVLETQFATAAGMVMVTDALVFEADERGHQIGSSAHMSWCGWPRRTRALWSWRSTSARVLSMG